MRQIGVNIWLFIGLLSLSALMGCAKAPVSAPAPQYSIDEAQHMVADAQKHLRVLESLAASEKFPQEFAKANEAFARAERSLTGYLNDDAYESAQASLQISQGIIRKMYRDIAEAAQKTKSDLETLSADDPENPLPEFLPELEKILDYSDQLEQQDFIDPDKLAEDANTLKQIELNAMKNLEKTLEMDFSFEAGKYELSKIGKTALDEYYQDVLRGRQSFVALYPGIPVTISVKVVGYADQVGFQPGTKLYRRIVEEAGDALPKDWEARRKYFNQRLSELRAQAIADYLEQLIYRDILPQEQTHVEKLVRGAGEELPPNLEPPYPYQDPRRRRCNIYSTITAQ